MPDDKIIFAVTEDHMKLVRRLHFQCGVYIDDCTHAVEAWPKVNAKRPLGNSGVVYDACEELGWTGPGGDISEDRKTMALLALAQLPVCLECFTRSLEIRTGEFRVDPYGAWFHYRRAAMAIFWREAVERCSREGLDAGRALEFTVNTQPGKKNGPYALLDDMSQFFQASPEGRRMLGIFEDEAVRRYRAVHENTGLGREDILAVLKDGSADMKKTWDGWPF